MAYATNNASRRASEVADLLTGMGVPARPEEVLTSAAGAAELLRDRLPAGAPVLVVGAEALRAELRAVGLTPVAQADEQPAAVVQGYGPQVGWAELAEASRGGAGRRASGSPPTPTRPCRRRAGPLPGNGSLVAALRTALGREPGRGGRQAGAGAVPRRPPSTAAAGGALVVGDRLDTDIEGASRAGHGQPARAHRRQQPAGVLLAAAPQRRPTYVASGPGGHCPPGRRRAGTGPGGRWRLVGDRPGRHGWSWRAADDAGRPGRALRGGLVGAGRRRCRTIAPVGRGRAPAAGRPFAG